MATLLDLPSELLQIIGDMSENHALYETNKRFRQLFADNYFNRYISINKLKYNRKNCHKIRRLKDVHYKHNLTRYINLTHLIVEVYDRYNSNIGSRRIPKNLPPSLTHLIIKDDGYGYRYHKQLDALPKSLTHLEINVAPCISLDNLPPLLTHLKIGCYIQSLDNLPQILIHLTISHDYHTLDNLPPLLTHLTIDRYTGKPLNNLPSSLTHLSLGNLNGVTLSLNNLPLSLTHLTLMCYGKLPSLNNSPPLLTHLIYTGCGGADNLVINSTSLEYIKFPFGMQFNKSLNQLPLSVKRLHFGDNSSFCTSLNQLSSSIKHLHFGDNIAFYRSLNNLPQSLEYLHFGNNCRFKNSLNYLPSNIKQLVAFTLIKKRFRKLPYDLKNLIISPKYNNIKFYELYEEGLLPPNLPYVKVYQEPSILLKQLVKHPLVIKNFNIPPLEPYYIKDFEPPEKPSVHNNTMNNDGSLYPVVVGVGIVIIGLIVGEILSKH